MISNSDAPWLAIEIAARGYVFDVQRTAFENELAQHAKRLFAETLHYRFTGEALFIHNKALGMFSEDESWADARDGTRLGLTLYAAVVPMISGLIRHQPAGDNTTDGRKVAPGRGFDSITHDDSNRGTIYDRETFGRSPGQAAIAALDEAGALPPVTVGEAMGAAEGTDAEAGGGEDAAGRDGAGGDGGDVAGAGSADHPQPADGGDAGGAAAASAQVDLEDLTAAPALDVAEIAHPAPIASDNHDGAYAEVVDDDDDDKDDDAEEAKPAPKRHRRKG